MERIKKIHDGYKNSPINNFDYLLELEKLFNIPIDKSRLADYEVRRFDYDYRIFIEVFDKKNEDCYTATYTSDASLLHYSGPMRFDVVVLNRKNGSKIENVYIIGEKSPIATQMTFIDGDYELSFERTMANPVVISANHDVSLAVRYLKNIERNGKNGKQLLFTKIYCFNSLNCNTFEQEYDYEGSCDKYTYIVDNNNVVCGIKKFRKNGVCDSLRSVCIENTSTADEQFFPGSIRKCDYPLLSNDNVKSAIIFWLRTPDGTRHSIEIYKRDEDTTIIYNAEEFSKENGGVAIKRECMLRNLSVGTISCQEIQYISIVLLSILEHNSFAEIITDELNAFGRKIDVRKGLAEEELDPLSPKRLASESFEDIYDLVSQKKNEYFELISEQYEAAIAGNSSPKNKIKDKSDDISSQ